MNLKIKDWGNNYFIVNEQARIISPMLTTKISGLQFILETHRKTSIKINDFIDICKQIFLLKYPDAFQVKRDERISFAREMIKSLEDLVNTLENFKQKIKIEKDLLYIQTEDGPIIQRESEISLELFIAWQDSDRELCRTPSFSSKIEGRAYCELLKKENEVNLIEYEKLFDEIEKSNLPQLPNSLIADLGLN